MKIILATVCCAVAFLSAYGEMPAFPGAEGFGSDTPGGRRGKVVFVNNLNDSGLGSFRAACETRGPRIVIFRVGGLIDLKSPVVIREPYITIAGQTAPGDGVCLRGYGLIVEANDVVVRYLRTRPGDISGTEVDSIAVGGSSRNVVIDHCSASWSVDEALSPSGGIADVTVQWCLIAEGLNHSVHHKGRHGYGSLVRAAGGLTLHHNLWAHNYSRNPRLGDNYGKPPYPTFDVRNNVVYDPGSPSIIGDVLSANYVNNYVKPGPRSHLPGGIMHATNTANVKFYVAGNIILGRPDIMKDLTNLFDQVQADGRKLVTLETKAFDAPEVHTASAEDVYPVVLAGAGATAPVRDAIDRRIISEVRDGSGSIIDSQWEVGGWPEYRSARPPRDSDRDGMPDEWETVHGLNPNDPSDGSADRNGDGYTNLEEYINSLATISSGERE
jgi:pectate lyase